MEMILVVVCWGLWGCGLINVKSCQGWGMVGGDVDDGSGSI